MSAPAQPTLASPPPAKRWRRRAAILLVGGIALWLGHAWLLARLAGILIVSQSVDPQGDVLVYSGDRCFQTAADFYAAHPDRHALTLARVPSRLVRLGLVQSSEEQFGEELEKRGVPEEAREVIGTATPEQSPYDNLERWLAEHPQATVNVLCHQFDSRRIHGLTTGAAGENAPRLRIVALRDRRFGPEDWWRSRVGLREFVLGSLGLVESWFRRDEQPFVSTWDPDAYEASLKKTLSEEGEAPPTPRPATWLGRAGQWLDVGQSPRAVDHILVLPGDQEVRPFVAAALVNAGLAKDVLVPRNFPGPSELDGIDSPTHEVILAVLDHRGLTGRRRMLLQQPSDSTFGDARSVAEVLRRESDTRIAVVTSDYHTRRARFVFGCVFPDEMNRFDFISAPNDGFELSRWWETSTGTHQVLSEFVKLWLYWTWYGHGKYWLAAGGIVSMGALARLRRSRRRSRALKAAASQQAA